MRYLGNNDKYLGDMYASIRVVLCVPESRNELAGQLELTSIKVQLDPQLHSSKLSKECPVSVSFNDANKRDT